MASTEGGMEIEEVAEKTPEKIITKFGLTQQAIARLIKHEKLHLV